MPGACDRIACMKRNALILLAVGLALAGCLSSATPSADTASVRLAKLYGRTGKPDEAKRIFDEIRADYPNAVAHRGGPLAAWLPK